MLMPDEQDLSESYDTCDVFHTFAIPSFRIRSFPANFLSWTGVLNPTVIRTFVVTAVVKADLLLRQALNLHVQCSRRIFRHSQTRQLSPDEAGYQLIPRSR